MTVRFKALWDLFIAELMKFGTVGGLAFLVNAGVFALLMATVFQDGGHLKAKAIATVVQIVTDASPWGRGVRTFSALSRDLGRNFPEIGGPMS